MNIMTNLIFHTVCIDAVVLISSMLLLNTFPAWIYPCLFYVQVSHNMNIFIEAIQLRLMVHSCSSFLHAGFTIPCTALSSHI